MQSQLLHELDDALTSDSGVLSKIVNKILFHHPKLAPRIISFTQLNLIQ